MESKEKGKYAGDVSTILFTKENFLQLPLIVKLWYGIPKQTFQKHFQHKFIFLVIYLIHSQLPLASEEQRQH